MTNTRIDRGGLAALFDIISDAISFAGLNKIVILGVELELVPDKLPEIATEISLLVEGSGWESQAAALIAVIGVTATQPIDAVCALNATSGGGGGGGLGGGPPTQER